MLREGWVWFSALQNARLEVSTEEGSFYCFSPEDERNPVSETLPTYNCLSRSPTRCGWQSPEEFGPVVSKRSFGCYIICGTQTLMRRPSRRRSKGGSRGRTEGPQPHRLSMPFLFVPLSRAPSCVDPVPQSQTPTWKPMILSNPMVL